MALALLAAACGDDEPDAYGNFEATEVVVSAETPGQLLRFEASEGARLMQGDVVALIDTTGLALDLAEIAQRQAAARSRAASAAQEVDVLAPQLAYALAELERVERLFARDAATARQRDQVVRDVRVLREQIDAARARVRAATDEAASTAAGAAQIRQRIQDSRIVNPATGTVLATYAEAGEFVQPGQPLYRIGLLDRMFLRAYVTGAQLADIAIGDTVTVHVDAGDELRALPGVITWVADEAEFTPTQIQSRDERADLVYAVRIRVPNSGGALKIGMPADVELSPPAAHGRGEPSPEVELSPAERRGA
ncbi:MAG: HlyD family secretion protein [Longimicrobiales bacterium]